jgi:hypothetical protein
MITDTILIEQILLCDSSGFIMEGHCANLE